MICDCGTIHRRDGKAKHTKTIKHQNYVKRVEQMAELNQFHNEKMMDRHNKLYN
jgi:hypothetical protein